MPQTLDFLPHLGFVAKPDRWSNGSCHELVIGRLRLEAAQSVNRYFREAILFRGNYSTRRSVGMADFELPLDMGSIDECKAFLAYYLRSHLRDELPDLPPPDWFWEEGLLLETFFHGRSKLRYIRVGLTAYEYRRWMRIVVNDLRAPTSGTRTLPRRVLL